MWRDNRCYEYPSSKGNIATCVSRNCSYALGSCTMAKHPSCERGFGIGEGECFKCKPGYQQTHSTCMSTCARRFEQNDVLPQMCTPRVDDSTFTSPDIIYVFESRIEGDGTLAKPYGSLGLALAATWKRFTIVFLLGDRVSLAFDMTSENPELLSIPSRYDPLIASNFTQLGISSLTCQDLPTEYCSTFFTEIDVIFPISLTVTSSVAFNKVTFTNRKLFEGLSVNYCPYLEFQRGKWLDLNGNPVSDDFVSAASLCDPFKDFSLFLVKTGGKLWFIVSLTQEVRVSNFTMQPKAMFEIQGGSVQLDNVNFTFVHTLRSNGAGGIVLQVDPCSDPLCGTFRYSIGSVTLLNNGVGYIPGLFLNPFLYGKYLYSIDISNVTFSYNFVVNSNANPVVISESSLLYLENFYLLSIKDCVFSNSLTSGGLIIANSFVLLPKTTDSGNTVASSYQNIHIILSNLAFELNLCENSLIHVHFSGDILNIEMTNVTFKSNAITGKSIVNFESELESTHNLAYGTFESVYNPVTMMKESIWISPRNVSVSNVSMTSTGTYASLLQFRNLANIRLQSLDFQHNGDADPYMPIRIYKSGYSGNKAVIGIVNPMFPSLPQCTAIVVSDGSTNLNISEVNASGNMCSTGTCSLRMSGNPGSVSLTNYTSSGNICAAEAGLALDCPEFISITITRFFCTNNTNIVGEMAFFGPGALVTISDSAFQDNLGAFGVGLQLKAASAFLARRVDFRRNRAVDSIGGAIYCHLGNALPVVVDIQHCEFQQNSAARGGALAFEAGNTTALLLILNDNQFASNQASLFGAALYVGQFVAFVNSSLIRRNSFERHFGLYGVVYLMQKAGELRIEDCRFSDNTAPIVSVLLLETEAEATTFISNVVFERNLKGPTILKSNPRTNSTFVTRNCSFTDNERADIVMEGGMWVDNGSSFVFSSESELQLSGKAVARLSFVELRGNQDEMNGGAGHLMSESILICSNCLFVNNSAGNFGGALFVEQNSAVYLFNSTFRNNTSKGGGCVLTVISSINSQSHLDSCLIEGNDGGSFGAIFLQAASLAMKNVTVRDNVGLQPGVSILMSNLLIVDCDFSRMSGVLATMLAIYSSSIAELRNSVLHDGQCKKGGQVVVSTNSVLTVKNTDFLRMKSDLGTVISGDSLSTLSLSQVRIISAVSEFSSSLVFVSECSLLISKSLFRDFSMGGVLGLQLSSLEITDSEFSAGKAMQGTAVYCQQCANITVSRSVFSRLQASKGGVLLFDALEEKQLGRVVIEDSKFDSNTADFGGAIHANNHKVAIARGTFVNNTANEGGAVWLQCTLLSMCEYSIRDSEFSGNTAKVRGGAVSWTTTKPTIENVTFAQNFAEYGSGIASFAISLSVDSLTAKAPSRRASATPQLVPGQVVNTAITVSLRDHYGQVMCIDNSSIGVVDSASGSAASISGASKVTASRGSFLFDSFIIYAKPNSFINLTVSSTAISTNQGGDPDPHMPSVELQFDMRDCEPGEYKSAESCSPCSPGTYSFDPAIPCQTCPENAVCLGNVTVLPKQGYWRSGVYSPVIRQCPNLGACLGGEFADLPQNLTGQCAAGFKGNLCQSCADGYSRSGKNKCEMCPEKNINIVRLTFIGLAVLIVIAVMVSSSMKSATRPAATHSIMIRIFVNYLQLVLLIAEFKLSWPKQVLELFNAQESVGGTTEQAYSIDCFLSNERADADTYYRKTIFIAMMPIPLIASSALFWTVIAVRTHNIQLIKREGLATIIILFFLILPNLVKVFFSMFSCTEIEQGEYWLTVDMDIRCWDKTHDFNVMAVALPSIIVWIIAVPLVCLGILTKFKARLDEIWIKMQYGFLINGYKRRCYYWEFLILYRKIFVICIAVFLNNSIPVQALTVQFILIVALFLQYDTKPFTGSQLNSLELWAIATSDVTIFCGLYYLTDSLSETTSWIFFSIIIIVNVIFIVYWVFNLLRYFIDTFSLRYHRLGRILKPGIFIDQYIENFVETVDFSDCEEAQELSEMSLKECQKRMIGHNVSVYYPSRTRYTPRRNISQMSIGV